jgi:iron complex transport system ATP-binding protein
MSGKRSDILLQTTNLSVGYGENDQVLLENLDLELKAGELVCFMGANGIGKSTLVRTLAGLQKEISGHVTSSSTAPKISQLSVVLTEKVSAVNMTVFELVTFGRYPYLDWNIRLTDHDKAVINDAIDQVNVRSLIDKKLYQLSDGQLQMAMIARALAQETPIMLLDEPTAHLDLNNRVGIMKMLRDLTRKTNKSILIATHELDLALQMADLIWLAGKNKNIIKGIPEDLVLNGTFDEIFELKGFDLKTGKIEHEFHRNKSVQLSGTGHEYLWTRNALERNGFEVADAADVKIILSKKKSTTSWTLGNEEFSTLLDLINHLSA